LEASLFLFLTFAIDSYFLSLKLLLEVTQWLAQQANKIKS